MAAGPVPSTNVQALYSNSTPGTVISPTIFDAAIADIVATINDNYAYAAGLVQADKLSDMGWVNVKDYGAEADGSTDDTAAIQSALNVCNSNGGGRCIIPDGEYLVTSSLTVYPNTTVEMSENAQIIVTSDIEVFKSPGVSATSYGNIHIRGGKISDSGVTSRTKYHINLINCYFSSVKETKIYAGTMTTSDVAGIRFSKNGTLTAPDGTFVNIVSDCLLNQASIVIESTDSWIHKCTVWAYSRSFAIHVVKPSQFISENQIIGSAVNGGVYIKDTIDGFNVELVKIHGNFFDGSYDAIDSGAGIKAEDMIDSVISGNDFWRQMDEAIVFTDCTSTKITENTFKNNNRRDNLKSDVKMDGGGYNTVASNTFTRPTAQTNEGKAISGTSTNNSVFGNVVYFNTNYATPIIDLDSTNILFNNTNSGVTDTKRLPAKSLLTFWLDDVPTGAAVTAMNTNGSSTKAYILGRTAKVIGIHLYANIVRTAGTLTLTVYKNGATTGETLTYNSGVFTVNKTFTTPINVAESDAISVRYTTDASWAPNTTDISVSLIIELTDS